MSPLHHHYQKQGYHEAKIADKILDRDSAWCVIKYCNVENEIAD